MSINQTQLTELSAPSALFGHPNKTAEPAARLAKKSMALDEGKGNLSGAEKRAETLGRILRAGGWDDSPGGSASVAMVLIRFVLLRKTP